MVHLFIGLVALFFFLTFFIFYFNNIYIFFYSNLLFIYIFFFIFGCVGSSFLCEGFLQLRQAGATLHRGARASHHRGLSCCGAQTPDAHAQQLWLMGPVAPRHVGSSQTRARTRVPCIGRQTLNHCATWEAPNNIFLIFYFNNFIFLSFFLSFLPFLLSCVADRVLVLQPGVRPEYLRWESRVQDIGAPETSWSHIISIGESSPRDLCLNAETQLHSTTSKLQ